MSWRRCARWAALAAGLALAAVAGTTNAQTGVEGSVESVVELSLQRGGRDRVQVTVSATVPRTALTVSQAGRPTRELRTYPGPITNRRVTARTAVPRDGVIEQTFTFGPQTP